MLLFCRCVYKDSQCVEKRVGALMTTSNQSVNGERLIVSEWMHLLSFGAKVSDISTTNIADFEEI